MSDQPSAQAPGPRHGRNPLLTALLIFIGVILLLPGLCTAMEAVLDTRGFSHAQFDIVAQVMFFIIASAAAGGVVLIIHAIRRR